MRAERATITLDKHEIRHIKKNYLVGDLREKSFKIA